ncbi:nuclear transport factor 2 [Lactarius vividus]|nr:nuclear transport factor 2 [Lactarius vividus]
MADINAIAKQFTEFYYNTFDSNRANLAPLYSLPFAKVLHKVTTLDAQPSNPAVASLIVSVTGLLVVDDSPNPLQFSQVFQLIPDGGSYYVFNDVFRLNYGA